MVQNQRSMHCSRKAREHFIRGLRDLDNPIRVRLVGFQRPQGLTYIHRLIPGRNLDSVETVSNPIEPDALGGIHCPKVRDARYHRILQPCFQVRSPGLVHGVGSRSDVHARISLALDHQHRSVACVFPSVACHLHELDQMWIISPPVLNGLEAGHQRDRRCESPSDLSIQLIFKPTLLGEQGLIFEIRECCFDCWRCVRGQEGHQWIPHTRQIDQI